MTRRSASSIDRRCATAAAAAARRGDGDGCQLVESDCVRRPTSSSSSSAVDSNEVERTCGRRVDSVLPVLRRLDHLPRKIYNRTHVDIELMLINVCLLNR